MNKEEEKTKEIEVFGFKLETREWLKKDEWGIIPTKDKHNSLSFSISSKIYEVIGNICDNPGLLKQ